MIKTELDQLINTQNDDVLDPEEDLPPPSGGEAVLAGLKQRTHADRMEWEPPKRARHANPEVRREKGVVQDFIRSSHGVQVPKHPDPVFVGDCSECGTPIPFVPQPCEFSEWPMPGCRCNACRMNVRRIRVARGQPKKTCSDRCRKDRNNRLARERRKATGR